MFRSIKLALAGLTVGTGLFVTGCASTPAQSELVPSPQGVACSKCQITYVQWPRYDGKPGHVTGYTTRKEDACPDCKDAAASFFATGKLQHTCKTCGDTLSVCESHQTK